jgi:hypothetical protein
MFLLQEIYRPQTVRKKQKRSAFNIRKPPSRSMILGRKCTLQLCNLRLSDFQDFILSREKKNCVLKGVTECLQLRQN